MTTGQFTMLRSALAGVEAVAAETCHRFPRHSHETYGIGVVQRGGQRSFSGRGMVEAGPGDIITVNPGEVHDGMPVGDGSRAWRMLYFDPALVHELSSDISEGRSVLYEATHPVFRDDTVARSFSRLFSTVTDSRGDASTLQLDGLLLGLVGDVLHERSHLDAAMCGSSAIRRVRERIDEAPDQSFTLADLASASGLSRFQVLRGFVRETGLTPHAYLMQRRIDRARRLIADGTALAEAAATSGFADQSHMTRAFRRVYGIAPGAYAAAVV